MGPTDSDKSLMVACLNAAKTVWETHTRFGVCNESVTQIALAFYAEAKEQQKTAPTLKGKRAGNQRMADNLGSAG